MTNGDGANKRDCRGITHPDEGFEGGGPLVPSHSKGIEGDPKCSREIPPTPPKEWRLKEHHRKRREEETLQSRCPVPEGIIPVRWEQNQTRNTHRTSEMQQARMSPQDWLERPSQLKALMGMFQFESLCYDQAINERDLNGQKSTSTGPLSSGKRSYSQM